MGLLLTLIFASLGSVGAVLSAAFIGMIPNALDRQAGMAVPAAVLAGILLSFFLEKMVLWRHCHEKKCDIHSASGELILLGDAVHNLMDGVVIGAAFSTGSSLGVAASLAVLAHEVPQEMGDFTILLESGFSRSRALAYDLLSSPTTPRRQPRPTCRFPTSRERHRRCCP